MNKILRYSFMALMAMMFGNVMADTDVTFTFNTTDGITELGITLPASGKGTKVESIDKGGVNIAATTASGKTDTRVYQGSGKNAGKYDFRIYQDGTLTFTAGTNSIKKVAFTGANLDKLSGNGYTNATDNKSGTWGGDEKSVTLTATGTATIYTIVVTYGTSTDTRTSTIIEFAEGYRTQIAGGPDDMFPQIGQSVALPTATVKAGDAVVAGATIDWSLKTKSWKPKEEGEVPTIADGKISFAGRGEIEITATYAGNATYKGSTESYTLKVYNSYGLLSEMVNDIADPNLEKDDEDDKDGSLTFYFFRNIDAGNIPVVVTNTVTYVNGSYIYLTDGENNLLFYGTNSQGLKAGDVISGNVDDANLGGFWGALKRRYKLPQFSFTDMNVKVESSGAAPDPKTITVDQLKDNLNVYVKIENAVFKSASGKTFTFTVGETEFTVYNQWSVADQSKDDKKLVETATYTLTGMGAVYKKDKDTDAVYQLYLASFTKTAEASVNAIKTNAQFEGKMYNVAGQVVNKGYKGLVIQDGRKFVNK